MSDETRVNGSPTAQEGPSSFTHYSLFQRHTAVATNAPFPPGGIVALLRKVHALAAPAPGHWVLVSDGALHPSGEQLSFTVGQHHLLVLLTPRTAGVEPLPEK